MSGADGGAARELLERSGMHGAAAGLAADEVRGPSRSKWGRMSRMERIMNVAFVLHKSATETALMFAELERAGLEITPMADQL